MHMPLIPDHLDTLQLPHRWAPDILLAGYSIKLGYIEFVMAGVRDLANVNQAGQLLLTRRVNNG